MSRRSRPWPAGTPCWADLTTPDAPGAAAFYGELLGWDVEEVSAEPGSYAVARLDGAAAAAVMAAPDAAASSVARWTLHLATNDVAASVAAAVAAGGRVEVAPVDVPGTGAGAVVVDPVGVGTALWQAGGFIGAEVVNEPGALVWEDLRSPDPDASRAFLTALAGLRHESFPGAPPGYTLLHLDEPFPLGGAGPLFGAPGPQWLPYFGVVDADAAAALVRERGGRVVAGVDDTPYGRVLQAVDPAGALFALLQDTGQPQPDRS